MDAMALRAWREKEQWFHNECARCAREAWEAMMRDPGGARLYLYFRRGALVPATDRPDGCELGCKEPIPEDRTAVQLTIWIRDRATRLPFLPAEDAA